MRGAPVWLCPTRGTRAGGTWDGLIWGVLTELSGSDGAGDRTAPTPVSGASGWE